MIRPGVPRRLLALLVSLVSLSFAAPAVRANVALPSMLTSHMVLQRDREVPIWGWAEPSEKVTVSFAGQSVSTQADAEGNWMVKLKPMTASAESRSMTIQGANQVVLEDVLVGEVWVCSGQSNMQWAVNDSWNADLTVLSAKNPQIRLVTIENMGVQVPLQDFQGGWQVCSPETVGGFSAVGYNFGLQLQQVLGVPVGLIDNAWGGSSCEAWIERDRMGGDAEHYGPLMQKWADTEAQPEMKSSYEAYEQALLVWQKEAIAAKKAGQEVPRQPAPPNNPMVTQHRPGNLLNGRVHPIMPFAIRGAIWYQGESNAGRAYQYRHMFPLMVQNWREAWGQGDFPFYWVQLADFQAEPAGPSESTWAELREAQTMSVQALPHSGQAVIIDLGEAADIHPRNKAEVAKRLARLALAQDYGVSIVHRSPRYASMETQGNKIVVSFEDRGGGIRTVDKHDVVGFWIAGEDRQWKVAQAKVVDGQKVEVWNDEVAKPVAVRYAWADNPVCNLFNAEGLPVTPFRTDDWPGITADAK